MNSAAPGPGLVLVAPGGLAGSADLAPAARLAALLGLRPLESSLPLAWGPEADPAPALAALAQQPPGWLLPLPLDPGQELEASGCWAEALAAWRQPVLLLLRPDWPPAGAARAYHALLACAGVPLLGLVQIGGLWQPQRRRSDGLPWLGWLPPLAAPEPEAEDRLAAAARQRWRALMATRPAPDRSHPAA